MSKPHSPVAPSSLYLVTMKSLFYMSIYALLLATGLSPKRALPFQIPRSVRAQSSNAHIKLDMGPPLVLVITHVFGILIPNRWQQIISNYTCPVPKYSHCPKIQEKGAK